MHYISSGFHIAIIVYELSISGGHLTFQKSEDVKSSGSRHSADVLIECVANVLAYPLHSSSIQW